MSAAVVVPRSDFRRLASLGWRRDPEWQALVTDRMRALGWDEEAAPLPVALRQREQGLGALIGREPCPGELELRWHISVQAEGRVPDWAELVQTAHDLRPGVPFCVGVPPRSWWMNVHPNVLHLYELRDAPLLEAFRANARGDRPT